MTDAQIAAIEFARRRICRHAEGLWASLSVLERDGKGEREELRRRWQQAIAHRDALDTLLPPLGGTVAPQEKAA
jgi:hypothetical protein